MTNIITIRKTFHVFYNLTRKKRIKISCSHIVLKCNVPFFTFFFFFFFSFYIYIYIYIYKQKQLHIARQPGPHTAISDEYSKFMKRESVAAASTATTASSVGPARTQTRLSRQEKTHLQQQRHRQAPRRQEEQQIQHQQVEKTGRQPKR